MGITRGTFRCARFHKFLYLVSTIARKEKVSCRKILLHHCQGCCLTGTQSPEVLNVLFKEPERACKHGVFIPILIAVQ